MTTKSNSTRAKVRVTVLGLLEEFDYQHLTYERIAATSGVAKTTLYRHWPSKAELVFDLVLHDRELPSLKDTGASDSDMAALAHRIVVFVGQAPARQVFPGVLAEISTDETLNARFHRHFIQPAQAEVREVVQRIERRNHQASLYGAEDLQLILLGSAYMWLFVQGRTTQETQRRLTALTATLLDGSQTAQRSSTANPGPHPP